MPVVALVGRDLGPFRVDGLLGEGAMSEVYTAVDGRLARRVALKVLRPHLAGDDEFRRRFTAEALLASRLNHPNVVTIYEAGDLDGLLYIAMRHVDGPDVARLLAASGPLRPSRAARLVTQAAGALDAAHAVGLVHRDVKPANMLITGSGRAERVLLADFGLTKAADAVTRQTQIGQILGTVDYMAPEQFEAGDASHLSDVYGLACVLYECLTGRPPFVRESDLAVLWAHVTAPVPPVSELAPVPPALDAVLSQALAKSPTDRHPTAGAFATDVRRALHAPRHVPRAAPAMTPVPHTASAAAQPVAAQRRPRTAARLAVAAVVLVTSVVGLRLDSAPELEAPVDSALGGGAAVPAQQPDVAAERDVLAPALLAVSPAAGVARPAAEADASAATVPEAVIRDDRRRAEAGPGLVAGPTVVETRSRTVSNRYDAAAVDGYGGECVSDGVGCVEFASEPGERFVSISIQDSFGQPVRAWVMQDVDRDGSPDGEWVQLCASTRQPFAITPGALVRVLLQAGDCAGRQSAPTRGAVTAVFSNRALA